MFLPSARRVELEVHCDDDRWSHRESTRSRQVLQRHLLILSVETLPLRLEVFHWKLRSFLFVPVFEWVLGSRSLFLTILPYHLPLRKMNFIFFSISIPLSRWFFEDEFLTRPTFPILPNPQSEYFLSKFPPRSVHTQERYQAILSCRIDEVLINLALKSEDTQPLMQKELLALGMVLQIVCHMEFSILPGGLGHFEDNNSIPKN